MALVSVVSMLALSAVVAVMTMMAMSFLSSVIAVSAVMAVMTAITVTAGLQNNRPQNIAMRIKVRSLLYYLNIYYAGGQNRLEEARSPSRG